MFESNKNQVGDIKGDYNKVIQIILSGGEEVAEKLGTLIERLLIEEKGEIAALQKLIDAKEELLGDKKKLLEFQDSEIIRLKTDLVKKQKQLDESEQRFADIFLENDGKDFSGSEELFPKALEALAKGNKDEALIILERHKLIDQKSKLDKEKEQQAASWMLRADLLKEKDIWGDKLNECYDFAAEIHSTWGNNLSAAIHYEFINAFDKANYFCEICLRKSTSDYERATTLNNLAILQRIKNDYEQAEKYHLEALKIRRKLAKKNGKANLKNVAATLNNLGFLMRDWREYERSEKYYLDAVSIFRNLLKVEPKFYLKYLAQTLNNLGILLHDKKDFERSEQSYKESLEIKRNLAIDNPKVFLPSVGMVLNNLANLLTVNNNYKKASIKYIEALAIFRKLALSNPKAYLPYVGKSLNNLGNLQSDQKEYGKSMESYQESLLIRRNLAKETPKTYLRSAGDTLNNLAKLHCSQKEYNSAEVSYLEALEIREYYSGILPKVYEIPYADVLISLSILYRFNIVKKNLSIKYAKKAIDLYQKYWETVPHAKKWGGVARENLAYWNENSE